MRPLPEIKTQTSEETCSHFDRKDDITVLVAENEDRSSNVIPRENALATYNARATRTIQESLNSQGLAAVVHDCACTDESKAETENSTSLDREALSLNNSTAVTHGQPTDEECSVEIPPEIEIDANAVLESAVTLSAPMDLEDTIATTDARSNMADEPPGSVCIEMGDVTEGNDVKNNISDKPSSETTIIYFVEGDSSDLEADVCRICHCGEEAEVLISPCMCTGSVKFVHHTCLMSWLQRAVMSKCELCLYPLAVKRKRKPLSKWRLPEDKPFPILWLFTYVVAMTVNIASLTKDGSQRCVSDPCIIFYVLGSAGALLGLAFFYRWLRKTVRYFAKWIALNQEWTLVGPIDLRTQLGQTNLAYSSKSLSETDATQEEIA